MDLKETEFARWLARLSGEVSPRPEHQQQLRGQVLDVFDREQADHGGRSLPGRLRHDWRWNMRHSSMRLTGAAAVLLLVGGIAAWFMSSGTKVALADLIRPIVEAKSARFKLRSQGDGAPRSGEVIVQSPHTRIESEIEISGKDKLHEIEIYDLEQGKSLCLLPELKTGTLTTYTNFRDDSKFENLKNYLANLQADLLNLRNNPNVKRESLGTQVLDGQHAIGYRLTDGTNVTELWGNPETGLPIRVERSSLLIPGFKMTLSDFAFNVGLNPSLFSIDPPAGYIVENLQLDDTPIWKTPANETDLLTTLRCYSEQSVGATFPDALTLPSLREHLQKRQPNRDGKGPIYQQRLEETHKRTKGLHFLGTLPPDADIHYAGKGVALNTPETPIFWYRPKDSKMYRVIYADLSVRDAARPPEVPGAQAWLESAVPEK